MLSRVTDPTLIWDTVPVRLAYAYIYHGVFACAVFMIYIYF
jgi:hypothetical protein